MIRVAKGLLLFLSVSLLFSCFYRTGGPPGTFPEPWTTELIPEKNWPSLDDDADRESLRQALTQSLIYLQKNSLQKTYHLGTREISGEEIRSTLALIQELLDSTHDVLSMERELKARFNLYQLVFPRQSDTFLTTGYYEATLTGSRSPSDRFPFPLYQKPDDLLTIELENFSSKYKGERLVGRLLGRKVLPYYSRREIDQEGKLAGRGLELFWTDDRLKLFFMQIQGSGRLVLEDGSLRSTAIPGDQRPSLFPHRPGADSPRHFKTRGSLPATNLHLFKGLSRRAGRDPEPQSQLRLFPGGTGGALWKPERPPDPRPVGGHGPENFSLRRVGLVNRGQAGILL